ncbi:C-type lectin domain-containing protein [Caenorhabditis elegans]|uniref:C-type lectin domain-containing protein n=1 Tax=Caenorhabditis elegans TaxID=6239 RepID=Q4W528_CAEEL|nr:C-type lectin domain-containing protein [Caenorhabditis elegans]CCD69843.1 C-type lectin domain-containing protein [Caenorhabditis elegans]|eukprot:NP_505147.3 C-type LECtin [Caenorhabditis elegans]
MRFFPVATILFLAFCAVRCAEPNTEKECQCILNNIWLDVYLLIDNSAKMGSVGLLEVASNVNSVFGFTQIRVGSNYPDKRGARVSVLTYSDSPTVHANLSDFKSTDELTSMIYALKPSTSYDSNLQSSLKLVKNMMNYKDINAPRNNTQTVIIIYAGDYVDYDEPTIAQFGDQLKADGVKIITVADISNTDHQHVSKLKWLKELASEGNGFNINDDYVSEEVQKALCSANCFCPRKYHHFITSNNETTHKYGTCVQFSIEQLSWTKAKFFCQNLHKQGYLATEYTDEKHLFNEKYFEALSSQPKPFKYHIGLHYVNGGYFWEQAIGIPLIPVSTPLYPLDNVPSTTQQCVRNIGTLDSEDLKWDNENCFNDVSPLMCEVPACDTENYCP